MFPTLKFSCLSRMLRRRRGLSQKKKAILEFYQQFACVGGDLVFSESLCEELQKKLYRSFVPSLDPDCIWRRRDPAAGLRRPPPPAGPRYACIGNIS
uniref:Uncharacterized protein n=1 Tax=Aegilops tauschii subsp. strangulata TaxID=200361 RepID=A0A453PV38_AEGTS